MHGCGPHSQPRVISPDPDAIKGQSTSSCSSIRDVAWRALQLKTGCRILQEFQRRADANAAQNITQFEKKGKFDTFSNFSIFLEGLYIYIKPVLKIR